MKENKDTYEFQMKMNIESYLNISFNDQLTHALTATNNKHDIGIKIPTPSLPARKLQLNK